MKDAIIIHCSATRAEQDITAADIESWHRARGFWTIGYGHLCDPNHPPITESEAENYLAQDLQTALRATLRYCPVLATESVDRLAAIVDFTFNLGAGRLQSSTLRRRINQRDWSAAGTELGRWVRGGGRVLPGLVLRRQAESVMLLAL